MFKIRCIYILDTKRFDPKDKEMTFNIDLTPPLIIISAIYIRDTRHFNET